MSRPGIILTHTRIVCATCKKVKNKAAFTDRQLKVLANHIVDKSARNQNYNPRLTRVIPCNACCPTQRVELECAKCGKTKELPQFSKQQRKLGDDAKCWACIKEQEDTEPAGQRGDDDDYNSDYDSEASNPYFSGDDDGTVSGALTGTESSIGGVRLPTGGTIYSGRSGNATASRYTSTTVPSTSTGSVVVARSSTSTAVGDHGTWADVRRPVLNPRPVTATRGDGKAWAAVPAGRVPASHTPANSHGGDNAQYDYLVDTDSDTEDDGEDDHDDDDDDDIPQTYQSFGARGDIE